MMTLKEFRASLDKALTQYTGISLGELEECAPDLWDGGTNGPSGTFPHRSSALGGAVLAGASSANPLKVQDVVVGLVRRLSLTQISTGDRGLSLDADMIHLGQMNRMRAALWQFAASAEDWLFEGGAIHGPDGAIVEPVAVRVGAQSSDLKYGYLANRDSDPQIRNDIGDAVAVAVASRDRLLYPEVTMEATSTPRFF